MLNCVGKAVASHRQLVGMSQQDLAVKAQKLGWDIDSLLISKIEAGRRRVTDRELYWLAQLFKCSTEDLFPSPSEMKRGFLTTNTPRRKKP